MPIDMVKRLGHGLTLLVPLTTSYSHYDFNLTLDQDIDMYWFKSVFGKTYDQLCDNTVIYLEQTHTFYSSNPKGTRSMLWI